MESTYRRSYSTWSGVDVTVTFGSKRIGSMQGISYTITREKAPAYVMGHANPLTYSRGKRGIAGSMIMLVLDHSNLFFDLDEDDQKFWASPGDKTFQDVSRNLVEAQQADNPNIHPISQNAGSTEYSKKNAWYHDQIPPFNAVLTAMTEYGVAARMAIIGIEILNSGSGISIDDITTDENMTFVARDVIPWTLLGYEPSNNPAASNWDLSNGTEPPIGGLFT